MQEMSDTQTPVIEAFSSGEEQQIRRSTKKTIRKTTGQFSKNSNKTHAPLVIPPNLSDSQRLTAVADSLELRSFDELVASETHLSLNTPDDQCGLIALKRIARSKPTSTSDGSGSKRKDTIAEQRSKALKRSAALLNPPRANGESGDAEDSDDQEDPEAESVKRVKACAVIDPWASQALTQRINALPKPLYFPRDISIAMAEDKMQDALRRRQLELTLMKASFEQELLQESGTFVCADGVTRTFPPCSFRENCVCTVLFARIQHSEAGVSTTPFACTQMFYPEQYSEFWKSGKIPQSPTPCLLCCRKTLADAVVHSRLSNTASTEDEAALMEGTTFVRAKQGYEIYQLYRNLFNEPEGYFRDYALIMRPEEAIVDSIVLLNISMLRLRTDPATKRRVVDQSFLLWKSVPPCAPRVGERESVF